MNVACGIPVCQGIVIGNAFVQETEGFRIPTQYVDAGALEQEVKRFLAAREQAKDEITLNRESTKGALGQTFADIFEAQLQILLEPKLRSEIEELIREKHFSAEHAVNSVMGKHIDVIGRLANSYIAEKVNDLRDIEKRLLRLLLGARKESIGALTEPVILLASNLTPSETANLDKRFVLAIVVEQGGPGCHTAILASALDIPCIVGTGPFLSKINGGDTVIVDAISGTVVIRPDETTLDKYHRIIRANSTRIENLDSLRDIDAVTTDGTRLTIHANIEFPFESSNALRHGADGIGLFRTEFLYLTQKEDPTEEEHFEAYKHVAETMEGRPVIIRTFDLGDDKVLDRHGAPVIEHNPALGLRGIRLSLKRWEMFRIQLRAILRASVFGDIRIMFPMISTVKEFRQAKRWAMNEVRDELSHEGIEFKDQIPVGMMVEVPAAAITLDHFMEDADFFSIGTNDLIQYTMAVDRGNREVNHLFNAEEPAVLRLIRRTIQLAGEHSKPVSLCGQMGGNPQMVVLLLGLGLRSISCAPGSIAAVKQICRRVSIADCERIAQKAMSCSKSGDVKDHVGNALRELAPDIMNFVEP